MMIQKRISRSAIYAAMMLLAIMPLAAAAQTRVSLPKNKYKVQDDVRLGSNAASQVERQMPVLDDSQVQAYVSRVGERLVAAIPPQFRQPAFDYTFKVINARDINAFALPGGPMYVNRGMIEAARNEGEMAGVMAHEISHVALRHATAQATETQKLQIGSILGQIAGAVIGGGVGQIIGAGSQIGFGIGALKYSRSYETQADVLGSQIMANAGYDPRDLANMFQTIARQSDGRGPEWLSSHPDPGNRFEKINREAELLNVDPNPIKMTRDFERIQARLRGLPAARSMSQIEQDYRTTGGTRSPTAGGNYSRSVAYPSSSTRIYDGGDLRMRVPSNWRDFTSDSSLTFAPDGAYGDQGITHGAMIGAYRSSGGGMLNSTQTYVNGLLQSNPYLSQRNRISSTRVGGRQAYTTTLAGLSPVTNRNEVVTVYTVQLRGGNLLTIAAVAPESDVYRYNVAFRNMINSIQLLD